LAQAASQNANNDKQIMNVVNVGYASTNYYSIEIKNGKLLVDCGWPGTLPQFIKVLQRKGIALGEIKYLLVTHLHPDHAGLVQELKNQRIEFILPECQAASLGTFGEYFSGKSLPYVEIKQNDNIRLSLEQSRSFLAGLGLRGEILHTPGHSDDSVTLILDEGYAFTGDLHPAFMSGGDEKTLTSWDKIHLHKINHILPGHGNPG
jgi:glyoxylase-like metal-dependent hydrolase (beta-lactamase superfamily II)